MCSQQGLRSVSASVQREQSRHWSHEKSIARVQPHNIKQWLVRLYRYPDDLNVGTLHMSDGPFSCEKALIDTKDAAGKTLSSCVCDRTHAPQPHCKTIAWIQSKSVLVWQLYCIQTNMNKLVRNKNTTPWVSDLKIYFILFQ